MGIGKVETHANEFPESITGGVLLILLNEGKEEGMRPSGYMNQQKWLAACHRCLKAVLSLKQHFSNCNLLDNHQRVRAGVGSNPGGLHV